jgi:GNAT superfamily N-acetyltransferase
VAPGDTYVFAPNTSKEDAHAYILGPHITTYVAVDNDSNEVLGFYKLIANQRDLGNHVSNASFMVSPKARGKGIGKALVSISFVIDRWVTDSIFNCREYTA